MAKRPPIYSGSSIVVKSTAKKAAQQGKVNAAARTAAARAFGGLGVPGIGFSPPPRPPRVPLGATPFTTAVKRGATAPNRGVSAPPRKSIVPPPPRPTRTVTPAHPAVGTGPVKQPPKAQHGAVKGVANSGNVATAQTVPADKRPKGGLKAPTGAVPSGAGGRTTTSRTTTTTTQQQQAPYGYKDFLKASQIPADPNDPFKGLTPQQIVDQMLAPQYAPLEAQQKLENTQYENLTGTINDIGPLMQGVAGMHGPGAIPPEFIAALSQQSSQSAAYQHAQNLQKITDARSAIAAQAPKLLYDLYNARTSAQQTAAKNRIGAMQAADAAWAKAQDVANKTTATQALVNRFGLDVNKFKWQQTKDVDMSNYRWNKLSQDQQNRLVTQSQGDERLKQGWARVGISTDAEQRHAAELQLKYQGGGFTRSEIISFRNAAGRIAKDAWVGKDTIQNDPTTGKAVHGKVHQSYQEAIREMLSRGIPLVLAQQALNSYWTTPGTYNSAFETAGEGRPKFSFQERQALAGKSRRSGKKK